ncbi:MAG TPA: response regulator, partial [Flavobacteriaceae bacterium]|nr:response regulator [Flavobacteriaceae bacterium]
MKLKKENILVVDDDYDMLEVLGRNLKAQDFHTYKASAVLEAIDILKTTNIHLLITDLQMPGINGMELLKYVSDHFPDIPKLVITGFPSIEGAVDAVKSGALDYLTKPFTKEELKKAVEKSLQSRSGSSTIPSKKEFPKENVYAGIVGSSAPIQKMIEVIE